MQISMWAKMSHFVGPEGQAPQITAMTYNEAGGYCLDAFYSGAGSILFTWALDSSWQYFTTTITMPDNATHLALESSLRCYGCKAGLAMSATWSIADLSVSRLDLSLRNIIRTNLGSEFGVGRKWVLRVRDWPSQNGLFVSRGKGTGSAHPNSIESTSSFFSGGGKPFSAPKLLEPRR